MEFHTHKRMNPDTFKLVVFGLPQLNTNDIKELKEKFRINLKFIKEIKTGRSSAEDALYMMEFFKNDVNKSQVVQLRYLCDVRVLGEILYAVRVQLNVPSVLCMEKRDLKNIMTQIVRVELITKN